MTPREILAAIRRHGGDVILRDGRPVIQRRSLVPDDLAAEARAKASALRSILFAELYAIVEMPPGKSVKTPPPERVG